MRRFRNRQRGLTLSEILIALALIGVICAFGMPMLLGQSQKTTLEAKQNSALETFRNATRLASADMGTFPMSYGLADIYTKKRIKTLSISTASLSSVPAACKKKVGNFDVAVEGDTKIVLQNGLTAYGVNTAWKDGEGDFGKAGDRFCLDDGKGNALLVLENRDDGGDTSKTVSQANAQGATSAGSEAQTNNGFSVIPASTIPASNAPQIQTETVTVTVITYNLTSTPLAGSNITGTKSGISSGTLTGVTDFNGKVIFANVQKGTRIQFNAGNPDYMAPPPQSVTVTGDKTVIFYLDPGLTVPIRVGNACGKVGGVSITGSHTGVTDGNGEFLVRHIPVGTQLNLTATKAGYDAATINQTANNQNPISIQLQTTPLDVIYFKANNQGQAGYTLAAVINYFSTGYWYCISIINGAIQAMAYWAGMFAYYCSIGNWGAAMGAANNYNAANATKAAYEAGAQQNLNEYNYIVNTMQALFGGNFWNAANQGIVVNNIPMFFDRNGNVVSYNVDAMGLTAQGNNIYVNQTCSRYRQVGSFGTPIKISLKGGKAKLDSNDDYLFDYDGFAKPNMPIVKPAGGLNPDEAWLVLDRKRNGIVNFSGIIDGDDVFGDHVHKVANGYLDMGLVFKKSLKRDSEGKLYFEVKPMPWWQQTFISIARIFGQYKDPIADMDLKLLDRKKHIYPASNYLKKVYVDYWNVNEWDKEQNNWIGQRAKIQFKDGHWSESADQWFRLGARLMPIKEEPVEPEVPSNKQ